MMDKSSSTQRYHTRIAGTGSYLPEKLLTNKDLENVIELEDFRIIQGGLEGSNVDPMVEMVQLLETQRNFESTQRAVRSIDDALKKATNEVGKYR